MEGAVRVEARQTVVHISDHFSGRHVGRESGVERARVIALVIGERGGATRGVLAPLVEAGRIRPVVDSRIPMRDAAEALRTLESSTHTGKLLLIP